MEKRCICKNCDNVVVLPSIKFDLMNDYGWIVVKCNNCGQKIIVSTDNPEETSPSSGGRKIASYDEDIYSFDEVQNEHKDAIGQPGKFISYNFLKSSFNSDANTQFPPKDFMAK